MRLDIDPADIAPIISAAVRETHETQRAGPPDRLCCAYPIHHDRTITMHQPTTHPPRATSGRPRSIPARSEHATRLAEAAELVAAAELIIAGLCRDEHIRSRWLHVDAECIGGRLRSLRGDIGRLSRDISRPRPRSILDRCRA